MYLSQYQGRLLFNRKKATSSIQLSGAEKKLLLLFFTVLTFGVISVLTSIVIGTERTTFINHTTRYFSCEREGYVPGNCSRDEVESNPSAILLMVVYLLIGLLPLLSLNFIINRSKLCGCNEKKFTSKSTSVKSTSVKLTSLKLTSWHITKTTTTINIPPKLNAQDSNISIISETRIMCNIPTIITHDSQ